MMEPVKQPEALIWGAGKIGRGFLAEIFNDAGYHLTFIDCDRGLVERLREVGEYTIYKVPDAATKQVIKITGYEVYHSTDKETIEKKLTKDDVILAIAVHQKALPEVIKMLVPGVIKRAQFLGSSTLDIILCVNMSDPASYCKRLLERYLPCEVHPYLNNNIGLVESVVMRITPEPTEEILQKDPLAILNNGYPEMPVDKNAFKGLIPETEMLRLTDNIKAEEIRKIYTLNMAHAVLAYIGMSRGYIYAAESIRDPEIRCAVEGALAEAACGLINEFGFSDGEMKAWNREIVKFLENPALQDRLDRLGRDVKRKLRRQDRLVGPALLCYKYGLLPLFLAQGIAYAFTFSQPDDAGSNEVRNFIEENGIEEAVKKFCGLHEKELITLIKRMFRRISNDPVIIKDARDID